VKQLNCATKRSTNLAIFPMTLLEKLESHALLLSKHLVLTFCNIYNTLGSHQDILQKFCCQCEYDTWHMHAPRSSKLFWRATAAKHPKCQPKKGKASMHVSPQLQNTVTAVYIQQHTSALSTDADRLQALCKLLMMLPCRWRCRRSQSR